MSSQKVTSYWYSNLYTLPIILTLIGLFFVYESSSIRSLEYYGDSFYYFKKQLIWFALGVGSMYFFSRFDYKKIVYFALPSIIVSIVLLIAVLIPGIGMVVNGARRWISIGFSSFQPAEVVKAAIIIYLSAWFQHREKQRIFAFAILLLFIIALIMAQPDMGTSLVVGSIAVGMYFLAGVDLKQLLLLIPAFVALAIVTAQSASYRVQRLLALFDVNFDPQGTGYHVRQILVAIQNGGLIGMGIGASKQKFLYLPEAHTDSIFAIFVEELGLVGAIAFIALSSVFLYYLYRVVIQAKDRFGFMLGSGIFLYFGIQSIANLASMTRLIPLTGVPLPFISYGGTHLFISFTLVGIAISISSSKLHDDFNERDFVGRMLRRNPLRK